MRPGHAMAGEQPHTGQEETGHGHAGVRSGNSQAVRLPKEFRFKGKEVEIFRRGDEIVLREAERTGASV